MNFSTKSRIKSKNTPLVVYKSKLAIGQLSSEDAKHLQNIYTGGLMRYVTPEHIESSFLKLGYVRHATGGLRITELGHKALMNWEKRSSHGGNTK